MTTFAATARIQTFIVPIVRRRKPIFSGDGQKQSEVVPETGRCADSAPRRHRNDLLDFAAQQLKNLIVGLGVTSGKAPSHVNRARKFSSGTCRAAGENQVPRN